MPELLTSAPLGGLAVIAGLGWGELIVIFLIVLVLFGPKALPQLGKALGSGIREFKNATNKLSEEVEAEASASSAPRAPEPPPRVAPAQGAVERNDKS